MSSPVFLSYFLLLLPLASAVHKGYKPTSPSEVPYATGFIMNLDTELISDCQSGDDDTIASFCSGGLISEGVFITAGHCFENEDTKASDGSINVKNLRVGLGTRYPYRNDDGSCSGKLRGTEEGIYKVKAVFIHKLYKPVAFNYQYSNSKTGKEAEGDVALDHMDVAVVFLEDCTSPVTVDGVKIAGGNFAELSKMWANFGSKTNTGGLPASFWGFGESEDDTITLDANKKRVPKQVLRGNWNFLRATGPGGKTWPNCDWLPDSTGTWNMGTDTESAAYSSPGGDGSYKGALKANPFLACTPRNPNDETILSSCEQQTSSATCTAKKAQSGKSYCKWSGSACEIDVDVAGGIGLVEYPSTGGGDSGSAVWYIENDDKLTLQDRDQLKLVHIGVASAATTFFPHWDQIVRTDYLQNWLATVIDRDTCAQKETKDYFSGFDETVVGGSSTSGSDTQSGWDLDKHFVGTVKGVSGAKPLSHMAKRSNAGNWESGTSSGSSGAGTTTEAKKDEAAPKPQEGSGTTGEAKKDEAAPKPGSETELAKKDGEGEDHDGHDHEGKDDHDGHDHGKEEKKPKPGCEPEAAPAEEVKPPEFTEDDYKNMAECQKKCMPTEGEDHDGHDHGEDKKGEDEHHDEHGEDEHHDEHGEGEDHDDEHGEGEEEEAGRRLFGQGKAKNFFLKNKMLSKSHSKKFRRLDGHDPEAMCKMMDCMKGEEVCASMMKQAYATPGAKEMAECMCSTSYLTPMKALQEASKPGAKCNLKEGTGICDAPAECKTLMVDLMKGMDEAGTCGAIKKQMRCEMSVEDEKCMDEELAKAPEEASEGTDFAPRKATPVLPCLSLLGLLAAAAAFN